MGRAIPNHSKVSLTYLRGSTKLVEFCDSCQAGTPIRLNVYQKKDSFGIGDSRTRLEEVLGSSVIMVIRCIPEGLTTFLFGNGGFKTITSMDFGA